MRLFAPASVLILLLCLSGVALAQPAVPDGIKELPRYSGAVAVSVMEAEGTSSAEFTVQASIDAVADFFNSELTSAGWAKVVEARQDDGAMLSFTQGRQSLTVGISPQSDGKVSYAIILNK